MVIIKKEIKKGIFADYQLDNAVRSNEQQLEEEEESEINASSEYVNDDIFKDYNLDEILKENEEHAKQKRRLKAKAMTGKDKNDISDGNDNDNEKHSKGNGNGNRLRSLFLRNKGKSNNNDADNNNQGGGGGEYETAPSTKKNSRSGTTVTTIPEEDENNHDGEGDYYDDDDDDDDDDSAVIFTAEEGRKKEVGYAAGAGEGVPTNSDWWVSPHSADKIFTDFDLDAIVKDYEKLQRKINFQPGTGSKYDNIYGDDNKNDGNGNGNGNDDGNNDNKYDLNNKTSMGITVRYRSIKKFWLDYFPRLHGILFRVLLPLWIMVGFTILLGMVLAKFEINDEIEENNAIMRGKYELIKYPYDETLNFLFGLPTVCFDYYLYKKTNETDANYTMTGLMGGDTQQDMIDATHTYNEDNIANLTLWVGDRFPPVEVGYDNDDPLITISEIKEYLQVCEDAGSDLIQNFIDITSAKMESTSTNTMSFNWMRCWNTTELGSVNPIHADAEQLVAAGNQSEFYRGMWLLDQRNLYEQYIIDANCTSSSSCQKDAHAKSIGAATGSDMCDINLGASAWFWFVFMTTVGK